MIPPEDAGSMGGRARRWLLLVALGAAALSSPVTPDPSAAGGPDLAASCGTVNPYLAVARFAPARSGGAYPGAPSITALRDTADDDLGAQVTLAGQAQTGAVYGLAYDGARGHLYASAYHRRGAPFGPSGPGGIYRVDLASGTVRPWIALQAGPDRHDLADRDDELAGKWVGRTSLGDIDVAIDGSQLFAANLFDGKIYRLQLPDGAVLGSFRHGGYGQAWQVDARLFALAVDDRWLYHGVMDMGRAGTRPSTAHIFRSALNGTGLEEVAQLPAGEAMTDEGAPGPGTLLFSDIGIPPPAAGVGPSFLAAFRDRLQDRQGSVPSSGERSAPLLRWTPAGGAITVVGSGATQGSLAAIPGTDLWTVGAWGWIGQGPGQMVDTKLTPMGGQIRWLDLHDAYAFEPVSPTTGDPASSAALTDLGDIEVLCPVRAEVDPTLRAAATAEAAPRQTAAAVAPRTAEAATAEAFIRRFAPTLTAVAQPTSPGGSPPPDATARAQLAASCAGPNPAYAVAVLGRRGDPANQPINDAVVAFNGRPQDRMRLADLSKVGAINGLAYDHRRGQLYAAAYIKRDAPLGVLGPGGIYRMDVATGHVVAWAVLPAGPDLHDPSGVNEDAAVAPWVGRRGLGDVDLSEDGTELLATNLYDGRIYRLSIPEGQPLGSFLNGGRAEAWSAGARPMGLGVWGDRLYHGVVNSGTVGGRHEAVVYTSGLDGSDIEPVVRLDLGYRDIRSNWYRWSDGPAEGEHQAMLSDIVVRANSDLLLGMRDRVGDSALQVGSGDLVIARRQDGAWVPDTSSAGEFYQDDTRYGEPLWGGLALSPDGDRVVSTAVDPLMIFSGGAIWFDNTTGKQVLKDTIYVTYGAPQELTFGKHQGLGDVESLCAPPLIPTFTPTAGPTPALPSATGAPTATGVATVTATDTAPATTTPTSSTSPTATLTGTASPTRRPTRTSTPTSVPGRIYLPDAGRGRCAPSRPPLDVVLVMDTSLSMTGEKLAAAQQAATTFAGLLDLRESGDRAAVVSFDGVAHTLRRLTGSRSAVRAALADLVPAPGTRIDLGLAEARAELTGARTRTGTDWVILLLTDGLPSAGTADGTLTEAATGRRQGLALWAVGLGGDADPAFLARLTGATGRVKVAPGARDLETVFRQVAGALTCR